MEHFEHNSLTNVLLLLLFHDLLFFNDLAAIYYFFLSCFEKETRESLLKFTMITSDRFVGTFSSMFLLIKRCWSAFTLIPRVSWIKDKKMFSLSNPRTYTHISSNKLQDLHTLVFFNLTE